MKSKERFIEIMSSLQMQYDSDMDYAEKVAEAMGVEINPYNNSLLVNRLVEELASWFDNPEAAKQEINRFMHELDFGAASQMSNTYNFECLYNTLEFNVLLTKNQMAQKIKEAKESKEDSLVPSSMSNCDPFGNYIYPEEIALRHIQNDIMNKTNEIIDREYEAFKSIDKVGKRLFDDGPDAYDDIIKDFRQWDKTWRRNRTGTDIKIFTSELRDKYDVKKKM